MIRLKKILNISKIEYKIKKATEEEIYFHLTTCNDYFFPKLDERVNIEEYSRKIFNKAVTFEAWGDTILIGLVAAYFNDIKNHSGYITNVSVLKDYMGLGIATELMNICVGYGRQQKYTEINLEVYKHNSLAINFYKKLLFIEFDKNDNYISMKLRGL